MPQFKSGGDQPGDQPGDQLGDLFDRIANSEAAIDIRRVIRDAVAVAVREAEERVNNSWESAWVEQKRQLRYERSRARLLGERMRSARALGRRARVLSSRCLAVCKPVLREASSEAPSWASVMPLVNAVQGLAQEAASLNGRAQEVFETVAKVEGEKEMEAPSSFPPSGSEWQEWEAEACYRPVGAPRQEWIGCGGSRGRWWNGTRHRALWCCRQQLGAVRCGGGCAGELLAEERLEVTRGTRVATSTIRRRSRRASCRRRRRTRWKASCGRTWGPPRSRQASSH